MHVLPEFQAVVLAAGKGSRFPGVGGYVSKCLMPVGPYPMLWYPMYMLERSGFEEIMVVVLEEDKSNILNTLENCPLEVKYELIGIPADEDWGTVDSLKHISSKIFTDLVVVSGDLITNVNITEALNLCRKHNPAIVSLFFNNGPEEWIELPGLKSKARPERDMVFIEKKTERLVFVASSSDFDENLPLPKVTFKRYDDVVTHSGLLDSHLYVMKKWLIDFLEGNTKFSSIKGQLLPYLVKKQFTKRKVPVNGEVEKEIFDFALKPEYEIMGGVPPWNGHRPFGDVCHGNILKCYIHVPSKKTFGIRVNTFSSYYLANNKIISKWKDVIGSTLEKHRPTAEVKTRQMDESSTVGEKSIVSEKTSIKSTFIAANCIIENKVRLTNCILMDNVTIKEKCVLQDCVVYSGATVETGCNLQHCLIGPNHVVPENSKNTHQLYAEACDSLLMAE